VPAELDDSGQFAVIMEHSADRLGGQFVNAEHTPAWRGASTGANNNAVTARAW